MTFVVIGCLVWVAASIPTGVLIGKAIKLADSR